MKLYGIVNCNAVKAARTWLDAHGKRYEFIDFKKTPPTPEQLQRWCATFGWETVLNRRGTTWRMLLPAAQARVHDQESAIALMLERPSTIKRPVLEHPGPRLIGFDEKAYASL